jgi:hypothetical protein
MVQIRRPKKRYEEHRKEFATSRGLESNLGDATAAPALAVDAAAGPRIAPGAALAPASPAPTPKRATHADEKLRLKFTVHAPRPGAFDYFDRAVALMGDGKALRLVLARAFDQLEAAVETGEDVARDTYPIDPSRSAHTSRHVSAALYASAKRGLDPMDLLPPGSFGRELAMAALAGYLKRAS